MLVIACKDRWLAHPDVTWRIVGKPEATHNGASRLNPEAACKRYLYLGGGIAALGTAFELTEEPGWQQRALMLYRSEKGVKRTIRRFISKHMCKNAVSAESIGFAGLARRLSQFQSPHLSSVAVAAVDVPGKALFVRPLR